MGTRGYPSYYGGFETAVRYVAPALVDAGWDVMVYSRPGATRPDDPSRDRRIVVRETWGLERKSVSTLSYGLTSTIDALRTRPDVALVMNVANGFWLPMLRARGVPSLVNVDGIEWDRAKWGRSAKAMFRAGAAATARWADALVFDAEAIGDRWRREFRRSGHFIPYGGVERPLLPVEPGLAHRGYALVVARFVPENTIEPFLEAAERIGRHHDVVIVGSTGYGGALDERVQALAARVDGVRWLGHVGDDDRLHSLWQHAGAYFHGHSVGGTNPALVQAMALGTPTVARDTVYNREVLGDGAVFVQPTAEAIADAIEKLLGDPDLGERLGAAALERSRERYTWHGVATAYESALRDLLPVRSGPLRP
jgi:glycosyltransferase involved in cell wall biosynthesis